MMNTKKRTKNAKIFIRVMPSDDFCYENIKIETNFKVIYARSLQDFNSNIPKDNAEPNYWKFSTDGIFYKESQQDVYESVMDSVLTMALEGCDAVIFCYGQTGSGKTFTLSGLRNQHQDCGLAPRLLAEMFDVKLKRQQEMAINYQMSFVELVSSDLKDLLEDIPTSKGSSFKSILSVPLTTEEESLCFLFNGESRRSIATSATYTGANLGHSILTIHVESTSLIRKRPLIAKAKIHLVDMSGINSTGNSVAPWFTCKEQGQSNLTKTLLEQFIVRLNKSADGISLVSPQGTCPFIRYLGCSLSRRTNVRFVGHIRGSQNNLELALSTLRFGEIVSELKEHTLAYDTRTELVLHHQNIEEELDILAIQLELSSMLVNESDWTNMSQGRREHLRRLTKSFLQGESSDRTVMAVQQSKLATILFKDHLDMLTVETNELYQKLLLLKKEHEDESSSLSSIGSTDLNSSNSSSNKRLAVGGKHVRSSKEVLMSVQSLGKLKLKGKHGKSLTAAVDKPLSKVASKYSVMKKPSGAVGLLKKPTTKSDRNLSGRRPKDMSSVLSVIKDETDTSNRELPTLPLHQLPLYTTAWEKFASIGTVNVREMQTELERVRLLTKQAEALYLKGVNDLKLARRSLDETRADLLSSQRMRHMTGHEVYDLEGRVLISDLEMKLSQLLKTKEIDMNIKQEALKTVKLDMNQCSKTLENMENGIENCFQEFCLREYGVPLPQIETSFNESAQFLPTAFANEERRKHYNALLKQIMLCPNDNKIINNQKIYTLH